MQTLGSIQRREDLRHSAWAFLDWMMSASPPVSLWTVSDFGGAELKRILAVCQQQCAGNRTP